MSIRRHLTYANVAATLSLVLVIGGGAAYAANTVFSSDIVDGEVRSADIANDSTSFAVASKDVAANTLTGADIFEPSLQGSSIGGVTSDGEVHTSGRISVNPVDNASETVPLLNNGTFKVDATCTDTGAKAASITIDRPAGGIYAVTSADGLFLANTSGQNNVVTIGPTGSTDQQKAGFFSAMAPNGEALFGGYHVLVNGQNSDCVFAASALGK